MDTSLKGFKIHGLKMKSVFDEIQEYIKCKLDIHYFAEKYCRVKTEDGSIANIKLRDYQKDILDLYHNGRFSILCGSRQIGKTVSAAITMLHFITFNNDKNIMIVANIANTAIEIIDKIKSIYIQLPFFLKVGIKNWNQRSVIFDNGCRIKSSARTKTPAIGFTIDFLYMDEFAHIPPNIIEAYYTSAFPTVSAIENSKIIITSTPNGMNLFYKLLTDAERPEGDPLRSNYCAMRVYWYQVPGRFVTYYRLNPHKMHEYGVTKEQILEQTQQVFGSLTKVEMKFYSDTQKDVILVYNNDACSDQMAKAFQFVDSNGLEVPIQAISETTTWKEEAIKDIGGEDAFNQEYGLRFINSSRSLLNEATIEGLLNNKKNYEWEQIYEFDKKLKFSYKDLKWIDDDEVFMPIHRKTIRGVLSVDISEGLGQDYSIINIFKLAPKPKEIIELQKHTYTNMSDFFSLVQIGMFRSNLVSVKQLAEIFYLLAFEYLNYDNFKAVLELNNYGNEFLAHLPHVFDGNNNYGSSIFFKYKHKADAIEERVGLKITDNKNLLVKEYQDAMDKKKFVITNEDNIREITTFVKHITSAGNIRYAADIGNDDTTMSLVNASSVFAKHDFRQMCEDYAATLLDTETRNYFNLILKEADFSEAADYSSIININKQRKMMKQFQNHVYNNGNQYFGGNFKL
jgi:Terminase large subunit, T4likevirus-type, N-terminal